MERKIKLDNIFSFLNYNGFTSIIINYGGEFFSIEDDWEKLCDVSQMPDYIKNDWIKYNKKELNMIIINRHIKFWDDKMDSVERTEMLNNLKPVRRDYIIKGII